MLSYQEITIRLLLAAILGAVVGLERERKNWTAGMRTHMMVCLGASLIMMVSSFGFADALKTDHVTLDPSRVAAQVVSGIGFLGAGTILFLRQGIVRGLTTASGLWAVAGVGLACGGGMYFAALMTTVLAIAILWGLQPIERKLVKRYARRILKLTLTDSANPIQLLNEWFNVEDFKLANMVFDRVNKEITLEIALEGRESIPILETIKRIKDNPLVKEIVWGK